MKWHIPIRTYSEANNRDHWIIRYKRHKQQQKVIDEYFKDETTTIDLPIHIKLTRYAPRSLDKWDNLPMAFKYIVDAICNNIIPGKAAGRADDDPRISIEYDQKKAFGYQICVEFYSPDKYYVQ